MKTIDFTIRGELPEDDACIDSLTEEVFGPGMRARAAYFLREGVDHIAQLSFVAIRQDEIVGTVRLTPVCWGGDVVLMLGPLAVRQQLKGRGVGKLLMKSAVQTAREHLPGANGHKAILLVGDLDYYRPFGFVRVDPASILLPRPADPLRVLACELEEGCLDKLSGPVTRHLVGSGGQTAG